MGSITGNTSENAAKRAAIEAGIKAGKLNEQIKLEIGVGWSTVEKIRQEMAFGSKKDPIATAITKTLAKAKTPLDLESLCDLVNAAPNKVKKAIETLTAQGHNIHLDRGGVELVRAINPSTDPTVIDTKRFKGQKIRFGVTADNHLGSKYYRADVLEAMYDIWQNDGIETVYQCGNMIDGDARFNRFDLLVHGMEEQAHYFAEHWPRRKGMQTYFITGDDHEGWYVQREGVDIGRFLMGVAHHKDYGRTDLHYLGHMEHDLKFSTPRGFSVMRLIHAGGGTAYALSYQPQSIINSYQGGEKPNILLIGHYHKAEFNYWREVLNLQAGCTEDQTPFMRKKNIPAHVGAWTVEFELDDDGLIHGFTPKWYPFYDRDFYKKGPWSYRGTQRPGKK